MSRIDDESRLDANQAAMGFDRLWHLQHAEFTRGIGAVTPMLQGLVEYCQTNGFTRVIEGGSGPGYHAFFMASHGLEVMGIEHSSEAIEVAWDNLGELNGRIHVDRKIEFVQGDFVAGLETRKAEEAGLVGGVYANALLHFFDQPTRLRVYKAGYDVLSPGGMMAVSFKSSRDALRNLGEVVGRELAGLVVNDSKYYNLGIKRLFVEDPQPLMAEMSGVGFKVLAPLEWVAKHYNAGGHYGDGYFVGLVGIKPGA